MKQSLKHFVTKLSCQSSPSLSLSHSPVHLSFFSLTLSHLIINNNNNNNNSKSNSKSKSDSDSDSNSNSKSNNNNNNNNNNS